MSIPEDPRPLARLIDQIAWGLTVALCGALSLFILFILWIPISFYLFDFACITEVLDRRTDNSGYIFQIEETNCDVIAKDSTISLMIARVGKNEKALLFKYFPTYRFDAGRDVPIVPNLRFESPTELVIAVPEISSIHTQRHRWQSLLVRYEVGKFVHPTSIGPTEGDQLRW